ncbi:MAG: leucine-rich repeat protein [Oscillospiraceae bacterium]|nr:leucine-rich repeat protein [Oscillospiraceae bacterium]
MKHGKLLSILSAALLGLSAAAFPPAAPDESVGIVAKAEWIDVTDDNLVVTTNSTGLTIKGYNGTPPQAPLTIQSSYWNEPVTEIAANAFNGTNITSVYVPGSVTKIGSSAFNGCKKLVTAELAGTSGSCQVGNYAFYDCTKLKNIIMRKPTYTREGPSSKPWTRGVHVFTNCTSLTQINSANVIFYSSVSGYSKPRLKPTQYATNDIKNIIKTFFVRSQNVKFVDTYCTELCAWIRNTVTRSWMSDAVKVRQYHDWIYEHCYYEDCNGSGNNLETVADPENMLYSSVFLSYGLGIRGTDRGESVCAGIAKAFTMLAHASGLESYVISAVSSNDMGHAWNIVRLKDKSGQYRYYQCDVDADIETTSLLTNLEANLYLRNGILYFCCIRSDAQMDEVHPSYNKKVLRPDANCFRDIQGPGYAHPLLNYNYDYANNGAAQNALITQCNTTFVDSNYDGLLDGDWNFDGLRNQNDSRYYYAACWKMDRTSIPQNDMTYYLQKLVKVWDMSPEEVYQEWNYS